MKHQTRSLVGRLAGHFLLLSLVIVFLAGLLAFLGARRALEQSVIDRLSVFAAAAEDQLRHWVASQREDVIFLASLPEVRDLAQTLLAETSPPDAMRLAGSRLRRIVGAAAETQSSLQEILILSDLGGRVALSSQRTSEGRYHVRDSFFTEGRQGTIVQNVYPSPIELKPALTISTPLRGLPERDLSGLPERDLSGLPDKDLSGLPERDLSGLPERDLSGLPDKDLSGLPVEGTEGELLGVLATHLNLDELDRIVSGGASLGATGEAYLVDRYNVFVSAARFGREQFPHGVHTAGIDTALEGRDGSSLYPNYQGRRCSASIAGSTTSSSPCWSRSPRARPSPPPAASAG